jgi:hypothetical protein
MAAWPVLISLLGMTTCGRLWHYGNIGIHALHVTKLERLNGIQGEPLIFLGMTGIFSILEEGSIDIKDMVDAIFECLDER